jgi:arginine/ornithine transport system substrate-binding protein
MRKILISGGLAFSAFALTISSVSAKEITNIRIGVEGAYPPYSWVTPEGTLAGFDIDIANALCEAMKVKCKLVSQDWDGMIPALMTRKFDAIIASMSITEERKRKVDFTDKYYQVASRFVAKKGQQFDFSQTGLQGKTIGVQRASTHDKYVSDNFQGVDIKRYGSQDEAFLDLKSGRVDLVINNIPALKKGLLEKQGGDAYELLGPQIADKKWFGEGAGIAVRKNTPELRAKLNQAIQTIRNNGQYKKIQDKYFDFNIYGE